MARSSTPNTSTNHGKMQADYASRSASSLRLISCLREQISAILEKNSITLGVPLESRIKSWASIDDKIKRKSSAIKKIDDVDDLAGIRIILLFRRDVDLLDKILNDVFQVIRSEDTSKRLNDNQFGYQSNHYIVHIPEDWSKIPSYSDLSDLKAEIQVRTIAQHMWAAASHKLQYKREDSVPPPLRRAINRASALLETIDLEFERVLGERIQYISQDTGLEFENDPLNVDTLANVLKEIYPIENIDTNENYDSLLKEIKTFGISTPKEIREILLRYKDNAMEVERVHVGNSKPEDYDQEDRGRLERGVYFTHCGLARISLSDLDQAQPASSKKRR